MDAHLNGGDFFSLVSDDAEKVLPKRGPKFSLDEDTLINRRDNLLGLIEADWGVFGWELKNAKSVSDVRNAFKLIDPGIQHHIQIVMRDTEAKKTRKELRQQQRRLLELEANPKTASREKERRERWEKADAALQQARGTDREIEIRLVVEARQREHSEAQANYEALLRTIGESRTKYVDAQAYFAQAELLRFVRSRRYSFAPINLANAMAGLPEMGWRQSAKRCGRHKRKHGDTTSYWLFKLVRTVVEQGVRGSNLKETVRLKLERQRDDSDYRVQEVRKNWYHLRRAFDIVSEQKHHPGALPYRIVAAYQCHFQSRSPLDLFLEEEEQLVASAVKRRKGK